MADSQEQKLISAIVTRMQTILTANGYVTNIGANVEDSRPNWDEEDDLPAVSVFQGTTQTIEENDNRRKVTRLMPVMIKVFFKRGATPTIASAYARNAIKDIYKAIRGTGSQRDGWLAERFPATPGTPPGLAMMVHEKSHGIEYADGTYEITGAQVEIEVIYITGKFMLEA